MERRRAPFHYVAEIGPGDERLARIQAQPEAARTAATHVRCAWAANEERLQRTRHVQEQPAMVDAQVGESSEKIREVVARADLEVLVQPA